MARTALTIGDRAADFFGKLTIEEHEQAIEAGKLLLRYRRKVQGQESVPGDGEESAAPAKPGS